MEVPLSVGARSILRSLCTRSRFGFPDSKSLDCTIDVLLSEFGIQFRSGLLGANS